MMSLFHYKQFYGGKVSANKSMTILVRPLIIVVVGAMLKILNLIVPFETILNTHGHHQLWQIRDNFRKVEITFTK